MHHLHCTHSLAQSCNYHLCFVSQNEKQLTFIPSVARPKAEPVEGAEGPKARICDLCAKRSGIGTTKVKKNFWGPRRTDARRSKMTRSHMGTPEIFVFLFLRFFQIFCTKMFHQTFFNVFTLKWFLKFCLHFHTGSKQSPKTYVEIDK